jgi:hypothetical protein
MDGRRYKAGRHPLTIVLEESSTFIACLYKQILFISILLDICKQSFVIYSIGLYKGLYSL